MLVGIWANVCGVKPVCVDSRQNHLAFVERDNYPNPFYHLAFADELFVGSFSQGFFSPHPRHLDRHSGVICPQAHFQDLVSNFDGKAAPAGCFSTYFRVRSSTDPRPLPRGLRSPKAVFLLLN